MSYESYPTIRLATLNMLNNPTAISTRIGYMKEELLEIKPDILCLQEVLVNSRSEVENILHDLGLNYFVYSEARPNLKDPRRTDSTAIFSRFPLVNPFVLKSSGVLPLDGKSQDDEPYILTVKTEIEGYETHIISAHLHWGSHAELRRLEQAYALSEYARQVKIKNPKAVIILGGDLNATLGADSIRYLRAEHVFKDSSTYWADSFFADRSLTEEDGITSIGNDHWGSQTAIAANGVVFPEYTLSRRIDYIMTFGWTWGGRGSPLNHNIWGRQREGWQFPISDHFGLYSDILFN